MANDSSTIAMASTPNNSCQSLGSYMYAHKQKFIVADQPCRNDSNNPCLLPFYLLMDS